MGDAITPGSTPLKRNQSVVKALEILKAFLDHGRLRPAQIAAATGLPRATALRLILTLEDEGFLTREGEGGSYQLGTRVLELAGAYLQQWDLVRLTLDELTRLRNFTGETVSLFIRDGATRICTQRLESMQPIRRGIPIGARLPLYLGASSKVLLAFLPDRQREDLIQTLPLPREFNLARFHEQIAQCRAAGYATSMAEREADVAAAAVPVFHGQGKLAAALAVSGPASRLDAARMAEILPELKATGRRLSSIMLGGG